MTTPADVLAVAASKIGVSDGGTDVNEFTAWYGVTGPWCAMFVSWCFATAGMTLHASTDKGFASCVAGQSWFQRQGKWHDGIDGALPGDVVFWEMGTAPGTDHVEIVERLEADGRLTTIGGNVGNAVGRFTRNTRNVVGYGRPDFSGVGATVGVGDGFTGTTGNSLTNGLLAPIMGPLDALTSSLGAVGKVAGALTDPRVLRRIGYIAAGVNLVILGAIVINRDTIKAVGKTVGSTAAAAYTGGASAIVQGAAKVAG